MLWILFCILIYVQSFEWFYNWTNSAFSISWITWNSWNTLPSVAKTALKNTSRTKMSSCHITFWNFSSKSLQATLHFHSCKYGSPHFSNDEICISCEPDRPTSVLFYWETAVNKARKACFKICKRVAPPGFQPREQTRFRAKAYLCVSVMQALFSLSFTHIGCFHQLMVCSRGCGKTD